MTGRTHIYSRYRRSLRPGLASAHPTPATSLILKRTLSAALVLAFLVAGCGGGKAHEAGPVPSVPAGSTAAATGATETEAAPTASTPSLALCDHRTAAVAVASQQGAAGTISTIWRVRNTGADACRSFGYPGMDFHSSGGWLNVQVHRGGYPNIDQPPSSVVVAPGQSLYFVSYWGDVDTDAGPCRRFDRVKVTLPDNFVSAKVDSSGCLDPGTVDVGPVGLSPSS